MILTFGWRNWLRMSRSPDIITITPAKTMQTRISSISNAQIMGRELVLGITKGKLDFGPWEQILYGEFNGRRRKCVFVKIIGE